MSISLLDEVKALESSYIAWLEDQTAIAQVDGDWIEVMTPFLDRHNDMMPLYVRRDGVDWELTDDGQILADLRMSGCPMEKGTRAQLLEQTLMGFGVRRDGDALTVRASTEELPAKKHHLIQAMLAVDDMFLTSPSHVRGLFLDDVRSWFDKNDVHYSAEIKIAGRSGYDHMFDFLISRSRERPERFIQTINTPDKTKVLQALFSWLDIAEARSGARFYIILNDREKKVPETALSAVRNYGLPSIPWSRIDDFRDDLVA